MLTQVGQRASHFHSTHSGDLGQPRMDSDMDQMTFWPRLPGEVPGNILCLSGTFCRCPHFSIPPSFLIFFPQRLPNSQPPSPHPSFYLLPPLSPPIYISCTLSLLFLQLFHRNDSLGLLNAWVCSVHLSQPSLTSSLWIPPLAPQGSPVLVGAATPMTGYDSSSFSSPRKAS